MFEVFDELAMSLSTRHSIILDGNTRDLFPAAGEETVSQEQGVSLQIQNLTPLVDGISDLYHRHGYSVVVYDNAAAGYSVSFDDAGVFGKYTQGVSEAAKLQGSARDNAIISLVEDLMKEVVPVVVIVRNAGLKTVGENIFVRLTDILLNAGYAMSGSEICCNQMLFLCDGPIRNDIIPPSFQRQSRVIHIGMADLKERRKITELYYRLFESGKISETEKNRLLSEILQKTDGMTVRQMLMVPRASRVLYPEVTNLSFNHCLSAIRRVRYGRVTDPWSDSSTLKKIYSGELSQMLGKKVKGEGALIDLCIRQLKETTCPFMRIDPDYGKGVKLFLMLSGPTGVGKTEFARSLCEAIYGSKDAMIQIDGGSLQDQQGASFLLGSAKGYVGSDEDGFLKSVLRDHPDGNVLLLLDELDKCHSSIHKVFLSLLDTGEVTDLSGERLDFRNAIVIFTSNVGIKKPDRAFAQTKDDYLCNPDTPPEDVEKAVADGMKAAFAPEFLGRLSDRTITLPFMTEETANAIVQERMNTWTQRAASLFDITLTFTPAVVMKAQKFCTSDRSKGGRLVNRRLCSSILTPIALELMAIRAKEYDAITVTDIFPEEGRAVLKRT